MLITHEQEKAYNAIKFFNERMGFCEKKKLFKLLYALDFEHFAMTGRTVTGYNYKAWKRGPVPIELDREIKNHDPELVATFNLEQGPSDYESLCLVGKTPFEEKWFSRRELAKLHDLADRFVDSTGGEMEEWTHQEGRPWHQVYKVEQRENQFIPFEYELNGEADDYKETILEIAQERESIIAHYQ